MNKNIINSEVKENIAMGILGAFLFSLIGGILYLLLGFVGFIASISGFAGVVCAIKGYGIFAKKETKHGIIISVAIAALVLIIAWYVGFCIDMIDTYKYYYELGEVDYVPSFFDYLPFGFIDLTVNPLSFVDLALSLGLAAAGCWTYVKNTLRKQNYDQVLSNSTDIAESIGEAETTEQPSSDNFEN